MIKNICNNFTMIHIKYATVLHTRWCLKNVARDILESPTCLNTLITLLADPPDSKMAKHRRKSPAFTIVSGIYG